MQSVFRFTFKDLFQHFFSEFMSVIGKRSLGQPCLGEAESQCTPLIIMKNLNFVKHQGWKTVQHFLVLICALAATRGSTSLWESARPNNSPQRPWHALHCLSFWQISLSLQFDFTSQSQCLPVLLVCPEPWSSWDQLFPHKLLLSWAAGWLWIPIHLLPFSHG